MGYLPQLFFVCFLMFSLSILNVSCVSVEQEAPEASNLFQCQFRCASFGKIGHFEAEKCSCSEKR